MLPSSCFSLSVHGAAFREHVDTPLSTVPECWHNPVIAPVLLLTSSGLHSSPDPHTWPHQPGPVCQRKVMQAGVWNWTASLVSLVEPLLLTSHSEKEGYRLDSISWKYSRQVEGSPALAYNQTLF